MVKRLLPLLPILALGVAQIPQASAAIVMSNIGSGPSNNKTNLNEDRILGITFDTGTNAAGYTLDNVSFLLANTGSPLTVALALGLYSVASGNTPASGDSPLHSETFSGLTFPTTTSGATVSAQTSLSPITTFSLDASSRYFLGLSAVGGASSLGWVSLSSSTLPSGSEGWSYVVGPFSLDGGSTWSAVGLNKGITIAATPQAEAPEPSAMALLALGLAGIFVEGRRRRKTYGNAH